MGELRRTGPCERVGVLGVLGVLALCIGTGGCLGPRAVQQTRMRYNEVYRSTSDEQLLMNIVRLRYADSPVFIDLPNILSQFELAAGGSDPGPSGSQTNFGVAGAWGRDTPTLSYHPREGREMARALLTPLSTELFSVVNAGANIEQLLLMIINDINDVPNAPAATIMVPRVPDDNSAFLRGVRLLASLQDQGAVELAFLTSEQTDATSDPIAAGLVQGRDLLDAAKEGYVFRARGENRMTVVKREKDLILRVRRPFVDSPEMQELTRLFNVDPGLGRYIIKSELGGEPDAPHPISARDTIYLNMRSMLQVMVFLSKGVCVPPEHVASGVAPTTRGPDGRPYDWTRVTAGNFFVGSQKHRPHDAEVAVRYRGYWFSINQHDVNSRAVLAILEILFSLQEADGKSIGPLLSLPLGGG